MKPAAIAPFLGIWEAPPLTHVLPGLFRVGIRGTRVVSARGIGGQHLLVLPDVKAVVVTDAHDPHGLGGWQLLHQDRLIPFVLGAVDD